MHSCEWKRIRCNLTGKSVRVPLPVSLRPLVVCFLRPYLFPHLRLDDSGPKRGEILLEIMMVR